MPEIFKTPLDTSPVRIERLPVNGSWQIIMGMEIPAPVVAGDLIDVQARWSASVYWQDADGKRRLFRDDEKPFSQAAIVVSEIRLCSNPDDVSAWNGRLISESTGENTGNDPEGRYVHIHRYGAHRLDGIDVARNRRWVLVRGLARSNGAGADDYLTIVRGPGQGLLQVLRYRAEAV